MWTDWKKLADKDSWYEDEFPYEGPAVYELGTGGPRCKNPTIRYVGKTNNERIRIRDHAKGNSHLARKIEAALRRGECLYYHAMAKTTEAEAATYEQSRLRNKNYDWNVLLNKPQPSKLRRQPAAKKAKTAAGQRTASASNGCALTIASTALTLFVVIALFCVATSSLGG